MASPGAYWRTNLAKGDRPEMRYPVMVWLVMAGVAGTSPSTARAVDAARADIAASLRVDGDRGTFVVIVRTDRSVGYQVEIYSAAGCSRPVRYREAVADSPLGLFTRDQDNLIFSTWSSGSAYRVRVWHVGHAGIRKVAELSSRARPDFQSDRFGRSTVRTFEREGGMGPLHPLLWTYRAGSFERDERNRR